LLEAENFGRKRKLLPFFFEACCSSSLGKRDPLFLSYQVQDIGEKLKAPKSRKRGGKIANECEAPSIVRLGRNRRRDQFRKLWGGLNGGIAAEEEAGWGGVHKLFWSRGMS